MNTFTDFIDVAEGLKDLKYCSSDKIFAQGGSAGGLLMGAVTNLRPDLWAGIVSQVPFVDVVTTMLDDTIPLTTGEYDEWGKPQRKGILRLYAFLFPLRSIRKEGLPSYFNAKWVAR